MTSKSLGVQLSEASWMSFPSYFSIEEECNSACSEYINDYTISNELGCYELYAMLSDHCSHTAFIFYF